jgi:hypothetical protein
VLNNQYTINMSTVRAYSNNKRISTGRSMKDGSFLQFYPEKKSFTNQNEWQSHWYNNCKAVFEEEDYADMPRLTPAVPAPAVLSPPASEPNPSTPPPKPTPSSPPPVSRKTKNDENKNESVKDWDFKTTMKFVAPPGTYYIGDICYFLKEHMYDGIFGGYSYESGLYTRKSDGAFFMVDHTAWGDGSYNGSDGFDYGVDAGIIGIVSRSLGPDKDADVYGGKLHTFKDPVEIKFGGGVFRFKSHWDYLAIDTSGDNRYNSDEDW